jgi:uncharacterized protein YbjT (DUF2867 family)
MRGGLESPPDIMEREDGRSHFPKGAPMSAYVITGVTGNVGSVVASELLAQGEKVKAIVRDENRGRTWRERGAEIAVGSLGDREFLTRALAGAAGLFALLPPDNRIGAENFYAAQRRTAGAIAAAVKGSAVPCVVLLSSLGAELADGTGPIKGLHYLENALRATGTKLIAIRASYFQENISAIIPAARQAGIYPNFLPSADTAIPMIATQDIGRLAARLLKSPPQTSEIVDLVGPAYSARQLSQKLGAALGKPLQLVDIPAGGHLEAMTQAGLPQEIAEVYAELYAAIGAGLTTPKGDRTVLGATPIDDVLPGLVARA